MTGQTQHIRVATSGAELYLAFEGSATHRISLATEHVATDFLAHAPPEPQAILDLAACSFLDSTFAGWMIKLQQRVRARGGRVVISHCPPTCRSNLQVMGLTSLFEFKDVDPPGETRQIPCSEPSGVDKDTVEFILHAHEDLSRVNSDNERTFTPITESLRRELDKLE